jgi:hypothetical protein
MEAVCRGEEKDMICFLKMNHPLTSARILYQTVHSKRQMVAIARYFEVPLIRKHITRIV